MLKEQLKRQAQLLIDAITLVESCETNLSNIEQMDYYYTFNMMEERKKDISNAKDQLETAENTLLRQIRYVGMECEDIIKSKKK